MEKNILTVKEVCELTGLARQTIYGLIYKREIPHFKFGPRLLRFRKDEILSWMESRHNSFRSMNDVIAERKSMK